MSFRKQFTVAVELLKESRKLPKETAKRLLREAQDSLSNRNSEAEETLQQQIDLAAGNARAHHPLRAYPRTLTDKCAPLQNNALKTNAALTLYPNARTTVLIRQFVTASENKLVEESFTPDGRRKLAVWNEKTRSRDIHEEIFTEACKDGNTGQFAAYYDVANRRLTLNFAGTVFTNMEDLKSALQTLSQETSMRMIRVKDCIEQTVAAFNKHYPGQLATTPFDLYAHSAGANAVALSNYFLQREHGIVPRAQVMIDPFGAKDSFEVVSGMIALAEGRCSKKVLAELSHNIVTFKPERRSFIESFKLLKALNPELGDAPETIGRVKMTDVGGNPFSAHQIRTWVKHFSNAELREAQAPANGSHLPVFKKTISPQPE